MNLSLPPGLPTIPRAGGDVRLVLTSSCDSGCDFCHLEGHKTTDELGTLNPALAGWKAKGQSHLPLIERLGSAITEDDLRATITIARLLGATNIHLTGGEPSLHPRLAQIVHTLRSAGLTVGMTSHAEVGAARFEAVLATGIATLNVSLHALTPAHYLSMDLVAKARADTSAEAAFRYAQVRLDHKRRNILRAVAFAAAHPEQFSVKANCVVQDAAVAVDIVQWCNRVGCPIRLQRDINRVEESDVLLQQVVERLGASPILQEVAVGDSSAAGIHYEYPGGRFKVKLFGEVYISPMCQGCTLRGGALCRERFYGVRIEQGQARTCIDWQSPGITCFSFDAFIRQIEEQQGVPYAIQQSYKQMRRHRT